MRKDAQRVFEKACEFLEDRLEKGTFSRNYKSHRIALGTIIGYRKLNEARANMIIERCKNATINVHTLDKRTNP